MLELLAYHEVELAASVGGVVETVAPVYAEQAYHGQEDAHAHSRAALYLERIEIPDVGPAVAAFEEGQHEDGTLRLQDYGIPQLDRELVVDVAGV